MLEEMMEMTGATDVEVWLSGENNFRYQVFPEYKANRIKSKRPKYEYEVKDYLIRAWNAQVSAGCEADDMLGIRAMELGDKSMIATIDKDLNMIPGRHYNFVSKELFYVSEEQAIRFFYNQCLVGDTADGVKGVPGIGPVKAANLLDPCESEKEMYEAVVDKFGCYEEFEMTAKVLWIWRKMNDDVTTRFTEWNGLRGENILS